MSPAPPISPTPQTPGYAALRRHRWSSPGADYFVTINLQRPASGLSSPTLLAALDLQRTALESSGHWRVRTWVVMPDHLHVLFTLGANSTLGEILRLFKGRLTPALRSSHLASRISHGRTATTITWCALPRTASLLSSIFSSTRIG